MKEWQKLLWIIGIFLGAYFIPWESVLIRQAGLEAFMMLQDYARQHVLTCLIPAFFHCRGDQRVRFAGGGAQIFRREGQ